MFAKFFSQDEQQNIFDRLFFSESDLKKIRNAGHLIGGHSHSHPFDMRVLAEDEVVNELRTSKRKLEAVLSQDVNMFAYPNGYYDDNLISIAKREGVVNAFTTGGSDCSSNLFQIPRFDAANFDDFF